VAKRKLVGDTMENKCRSGCPTPGAHSSWGDCARAANVGIGAGETSPAFIARKKWDTEIESYAYARSQGIQPASTQLQDIATAIDISQKTDKAFDASKPIGTN